VGRVVSTLEEQTIDEEQVLEVFYANHKFGVH